MGEAKHRKLHRQIQSIKNRREVGMLKNLLLDKNIGMFRPGRGRSEDIRDQGLSTKLESTR